jgi:hypothetical protein
VTILILLALALSRPYHVETVDSLKLSRHTHVQVAGTVTLVRHEADGDVHIRVSDEHGHFIVAEIIPLIPLAAPKVGQGIAVFGIRREDNERGHGWSEVHPVERWLEAVP